VAPEPLWEEDSMIMRLRLRLMLTMAALLRW
jgi:hypothetical protein